MNEHERIILQAAANILRAERVTLPDRGTVEASYAAGCARYAAEEIDNFIARYDDLLVTAGLPQNRRNLRVAP